MEDDEDIHFKRHIERVCTDPFYDDKSPHSFRNLMMVQQRQMKAEKDSVDWYSQ